MLDYRIRTFLQLCQTMNYREAAEHLHLTQPAVTQQIHYLEQAYGCKLFFYDGKTLTKTKAAELLERYARSALYDQQAVQQAMSHAVAQQTLRIGATKTIGNYMIAPQIAALLQSERYHLSILVENTEHLLKLLDQNELDFALIEGFFDKNAYGHQLFRRERFVGICPPTHPFAGRQISLPELLQETLLLREPGSGTRAVLEQVLTEWNLSVDSFRSVCCVSSFSLTRDLVRRKAGLSFVYQAVADSDPSLSTFLLPGPEIVREMNYVYLKNSCAAQWISLFDPVHISQNAKTGEH